MYDEDMEESRATHSSILAWRIPWIEEPGRLQFMGSQRVRHDWSNLAHGLFKHPTSQLHFMLKTNLFVLFSFKILYLRAPKEYKRRREKSLASILFNMDIILSQAHWRIPVSCRLLFSSQHFNQPAHTGQRHNRGWVKPAGIRSMQESFLPSVIIYRKLTSKVWPNSSQVLSLTKGFKSICSWMWI